MPKGSLCKGARLKRGPSAYLYLKYLCHRFSSPVPSTSLTILLDCRLQPMSQYKIAYLAMFSSKKRVQPVVLPGVLATVKSSLHHCPSGMSLEGATVLPLFTFGWCLYNVQHYLQNQAPVFFSSVSWSDGKRPWCMLEDGRQYSRSKNHGHLGSFFI